MWHTLVGTARAAPSVPTLIAGVNTLGTTNKRLPNTKAVKVLQHNPRNGNASENMVMI
jgi:hypothetical protein